MIPSNAVLSRNIQYLLHCHRLEQNLNPTNPHSVFNIVSQQKSNNIADAQKELLSMQPRRPFIQEDNRLINHNYSLKKMKGVPRRKKSSYVTIDNSNQGINRYNMSVDSTIEIPTANTVLYRPRDSSIELRREERLLRKRGATKYLLKSMTGKCRLEQLRNRAVKENCRSQNQTQLQESKQVEPKRKQWICSKAPITKRYLPSEQFSLMNFRSLNSSIRVFNKCTIEPQKSTSQQQKQTTIKAKIGESPQLDKQNSIYPEAIHLSPKQPLAKKDYSRTRKSRQMFLNRALQSKTQILKREKERICPWGRLPELVVEEQSLFFHRY